MNFLEHVSDIFNITPFDDYKNSDLAIDNRPIAITDMKTAHNALDPRYVQLLYNQYLIRWFFGLEELTPYLIGSKVPYNSIQFKDAFLNDKFEQYTYGGLFACPQYVLGVFWDYYYHREAFRLLYGYLSDETTINGWYVKYISSDVSNRKISLHQNVLILRDFFLGSMLSTVVDKYEAILSMSELLSLSKTDKAYVTQLHDLACGGRSLYQTDLLYELHKIYRLSEEIIYE